jgi:L,D-transpeptidase-like protein
MKCSKWMTCAMVGIALWATPSTAGAAGDEAALVERVSAIAGGPSRVALDAAMSAYDRARQMGAIAHADLLTLIDYTRPSVEPRLWVIDIQSGAVLYHELVAHGRGSGDNLATSFSNDDNSHMSSLGLYVTRDTYVGHNGYSLRLLGLDAGLNDHALSRAIVIHGAPYVSEKIGQQAGRLGRSWGCPAVRPEIAHALIDTIKGGTVVFAYGPGLDARRTS